MDQDIWEELEALDVPRGVVKAANLYAAQQIPLTRYIESMQDLEGYLNKNKDCASHILKAAQSIYERYFDAFIAGAKWATENNK